MTAAELKGLSERKNWQERAADYGVRIEVFVMIFLFFLLVGRCPASVAVPHHPTPRVCAHQQSRVSWGLQGQVSGPVLGGFLRECCSEDLNTRRRAAHSGLPMPMISPVCTKVTAVDIDRQHFQMVTSSPSTTIVSASQKSCSEGQRNPQHVSPELHEERR